MNLKNKKYFNKRNFIKLLDKVTTIIIFTCLISIFLFLSYASLRAFICDQFIVPTKSMEPTLIAGDRILVNKLIFGGRIYKNFDFNKNIPLKSWRAWGIREIHTNDVLVFNYPHGFLRNKIEFKINYVYAKRCIGCPGDKVSIIGGFYKNNNYKELIGDSLMQKRLMSIPDSLLINQYNFYTIPYINENSPWTIKEFGPLYIPASNSKIDLNTFNFYIYKNMIEYETGEEPIIWDNKIYLGHEELKSYTFKKNYYFMGGDNVLNSKDSRYIGLVPEEFIIGVATKISYNKDDKTQKIRWNRFFKTIK